MVQWAFGNAATVRVEENRLDEVTQVVKII